MEIFPFRFLRRGFAQYLAFANAVHAEGGGRRTIEKLHAAGELVVRGMLLFPQFGIPYATFESFWAGRSGGFESFLYRPQGLGAAAAHDAFVSATGQVDFTASRRYVDTLTLVVRKGGLLQTPGTHYTLRNESGGVYALGLSTRLVVHFLAAPGNGVAVTLDYAYYVPVRFEGDELPEDQELHAGGAGSAAIADRSVAVRLRETGPGFSYADAPNAL